VKSQAAAPVTGRCNGVLLALRGEDEPRETLNCAHRLANALGQSLVVVRVLPAQSKFLSAVRVLLRSQNAAVRPRDVYKATRRWLLRYLGTPAKAVRILLTTGEFVSEASSCARRTRAHTIVMSPNSRRAGDQAIALAQASGARVLLARGDEGRSPILAATDLQDPAFPVLRSAAEVARILKQPMIAFHNVDPFSAMGSTVASVRGTEAGVSKATRRAWLVSASRSLKIEPNAVLTTELDPAHAIMDEAQACDASIIVVGARSCAWWRRLMGERVSVRVANQSDSSVLVTPIP